MGDAFFVEQSGRARDGRLQPRSHDYDMISSGTTLGVAGNLVEKAGGCAWIAAATHALCVGKVNENLKGLSKILVTDTITSGRLSDETEKRMTVLSATKLFAQVIPPYS